MLDIKIIEFNNDKEFNLWLKNFNNETAIYLDKMKMSYLLQCINYNSRKIFNDWWEGRSIFTDEYKNKYIKSDWDNAYNLIMDAISNGLG